LRKERNKEKDSGGALGRGGGWGPEAEPHLLRRGKSIKIRVHG